MFIKALVQYYENHPELFHGQDKETNNISFIIYLDEDGKLLSLRDCRKDGHGIPFITARTFKRSSQVAPFCMFDKLSYVLGYSMDKKKAAVKCLLSFIDSVNEFKKKLPDNVNVKAVCAFYDRYRFQDKTNEETADIFKDYKAAPDMFKAIGNISFVVQGHSDEDAIAASDPEIIAATKREVTKTGTCMITGKSVPIARVHNSVPFPVYDDKKKKYITQNVTAVSFQKDSGYDSQKLEQGYNAPISVYAMNAYTSALNHLLRFDSPNFIMPYHDRKYVFWSAGKNEDNAARVDEELNEFFGTERRKNKDNAAASPFRELLERIRKGESIEGDNEKFFIFGLDNNSTRLIVRYFAELTPSQFAKNILRHYNDIKIGETEDKDTGPGIYALLASVAPDGKTDRLPSMFYDNLLRSIIEGVPYDISLFYACVNKIQTSVNEKDIQDKPICPITKTRAGIIRGYLNRKINYNKIPEMLDTERNDKGYLCGRLFAVYDRMQYLANKQNSIRRDYMNAVMQSPATTFGSIEVLSNAHHSKLLRDRKILTASILDELKSEICDKIGTFPNQLSMTEKGEFVIGFYLQKIAMRKKDESSNEQEKSEEE